MLNVSVFRKLPKESNDRENESHVLSIFYITQERKLRAMRTHEDCSGGVY